MTRRRRFWKRQHRFSGSAAPEQGPIRDGTVHTRGQSIIYAAAWNGEPLKLFIAPSDNRIRPAVVAQRTVVSVSKTGELAISLSHTYDGWMGEGSLGRSSLLGTAPRVIAERARSGMDSGWQRPSGRASRRRLRATRNSR